jgi:hypothetical protein
VPVCSRNWSISFLTVTDVENRPLLSIARHAASSVAYLQTVLKGSADTSQGPIWFAQTRSTVATLSGGAFRPYPNGRGDEMSRHRPAATEFQRTSRTGHLHSGRKKRSPQKRREDTTYKGAYDRRTFLRISVTEISSETRVSFLRVLTRSRGENAPLLRDPSLKRNRPPRSSPECGG